MGGDTHLRSERKGEDKGQSLGSTRDSHWWGEDSRLGIGMGTLTWDGRAGTAT
jgi:hypothetical protein